MTTSIISLIAQLDNGYRAAINLAGRVASRNFLTICLTRFITFSVPFRVTTHVFG
jgi:hypothetical protein